jgi:hypothetical protein
MVISSGQAKLVKRIFHVCLNETLSPDYCSLGAASWFRPH